ncbi:MAG: hypothetical protein NVS4B11_17440 [Ktedonobacteraceae bacterium]
MGRANVQKLNILLGLKHSVEDVDIVWKMWTLCGEHDRGKPCHYYTDPHKRGFATRIRV